MPAAFDTATGHINRDDAPRVVSEDEGGFHGAMVLRALAEGDGHARVCRHGQAGLEQPQRRRLAHHPVDDER